MSADLNKSEITLAVTEAAAQWLAGIGAKAIETEVLVAQGWIADLAAFWVPTPTEAMKSKLLPKQPRWDFVFNEDKSIKEFKNDTYQKQMKAWKESFAAIPGLITIAHEVKTSRSDFRKDRKWDRDPVADIQVLSYVSGIIDDDEVPKGWWGLKHSRTGTLLKVTKRALLRGIDNEQRLFLVAWLADRMHNRHANKFFNDLNKRHRTDQRKRITSGRLSSCMTAILGIARGEKTVEEAMTYYFCQDERIPHYLQKDLKEIEGVLKPVKDAPVGELDK